ncbi:MAG TPA: outer membrane beta-barrel protein [Candidatus Acidoferrum sp.]|nr:outer membrane beta-barrel protein [Candidatus Acidoferrum sp.]
MRIWTRIIVLFGLTLALLPSKSAVASAQSLSSMEVGANYNYVRTNAPPGGCGCFSMNGGGAWISYDPFAPVSIVGELSVQHASNISGSGADLTLTSYQAGFRYRFPQVRRIVPFAQVLLGGSHASGNYASDGGFSNAFAATMGGGIDVQLTNRVAVRAFQADYYFTHFSNGVNDHQNNLRISMGLVFKLGKQ